MGAAAGCVPDRASAASACSIVHRSNPSGTVKDLLVFRSSPTALVHHFLDPAGDVHPVWLRAHKRDFAILGADHAKGAGIGGGK